jgi:hypothetical protein
MKTWLLVVSSTILLSLVFTCSTVYESRSKYVELGDLRRTTPIVGFYCISVEDSVIIAKAWTFSNELAAIVVKKIESTARRVPLVESEFDFEPACVFRAPTVHVQSVLYYKPFKYKGSEGYVIVSDVHIAGTSKRRFVAHKKIQKIGEET